MVIVFLSFIFVSVLYVEAIRKGMPVKRWLLLGATLGPVAWFLFNVHYRRALMRMVAQHGCAWRP